jgi:Cd2+/Zn2+-exporting ATPase
MSKPLHTSTFHVRGLCCVDEEILIRKKLSSLPGISSFTFNLVSQKLTVQHSCAKEEIVNALHDAGFTATTFSTREEPKSFWDKHSGAIFTSTAGLLTLVGIAANLFGYSKTLTIPMFIAAILAGGWKIAWRAYQAAKNLTLDMNFLMTIATIGAMIIGEWAEAAAVIVLFSLALLLESYSIERTRKAVRTLLTLMPKQATVKRGQFEINMPVEQIQIGDVLVIRPGENIPLDGQVLSGFSTVNQASITGESLPVEKEKGDVVYAGTTNQRGSLEMEVTKLAPDTMLARITQLIEEAQAQRAPSQTFVEKFAKYYTPTVIVVAALIATVPPLAFTEPFVTWFYRALVLLVIACPCALVISTPVSIVSALTNAARHGVLIKGGRYLEEVGAVNAIAFDKTGTLTEGTPRVTDVIPLNSLTPEQIIRIAAAIEAKSEHHLASAILMKAYEENIAIDNVTYQRFEALMGRGVKATVDGTVYYIGNHELIEERGICSPRVEQSLHRLESEGKTAIILGTEKAALGIIAIADTLRSEASGVMRRLESEGIKKLIMITGDNEGTARAIAEKVGINEFHASVLPDEKVRHTQRLKQQYGKVAMIGDGINDAPALAAADVGVAMGVSGTDTALETADIVLTSDDLPKITHLIALSKRTLRVVKQNITIALATKAVFLLLGALGAATLWMAILADDGAALVVILNSLRLLRFGKV